MKYIKELLKAEKSHILVLDALFSLYIFVDIETPVALAKLVDNTLGNVAVMLFALTIFYIAGPVVGVLAVLAAYSLIKRSSRATGTLYRQPEYEAEEIKMKMLSEYNSFPRTLEEDVITEMSPIIRDDGGMNADYKPVLGNLNNASPIE